MFVGWVYASVNLSTPDLSRGPSMHKAVAGRGVYLGSQKNPQTKKVPPKGPINV